MTALTKSVKREIPTRPPLRKPLIAELKPNGVLELREKGARVFKVEIELQALYMRLAAAKARGT